MIKLRSELSYRVQKSEQQNIELVSWAHTYNRTTMMLMPLNQYRFDDETTSKQWTPLSQPKTESNNGVFDCILIKRKTPRRSHNKSNAKLQSNGFSKQEIYRHEVHRYTAIATMNEFRLIHNYFIFFLALFCGRSDELVSFELNLRKKNGISNQ